MSDSKTITVADWYLIGLTGHVDDPYAKNTNQKLGGYLGRTSHCWEALFHSDISSSIPTGSTITSVTINVNVIGNSNAPDGVLLAVHKNDKGAWVDNGSTTPARGQPPFDDSSAFPTALSSVAVNGLATGIFTIPSTPELVAFAQDSLDNGTNGVILSYYTEFWDYYLNFDNIEFDIIYESGVTRRRIMIIS